MKALKRKLQNLAFLKLNHKALILYREALKEHPDDSELREGFAKLRASIFSETLPEDQRKRRAEIASSEPEIQAIMRDMTMQSVLRSIEGNPERIADYLRDKDIAHNLETLIAAGILRVN